MGLIPQKPYQVKNKETGRFEWVYPKPIEYTNIKETIRPIELYPNKIKK